MRAAICSRPASCSTKWRRAGCRFPARLRRPSSKGILTKPPVPPSQIDAGLPRGLRSGDRPSARKGSRHALPERRGPACRAEAAAEGGRERGHRRRHDRSGADRRDASSGSVWRRRRSARTPAVAQAGAGRRAAHYPRGRSAACSSTGRRARRRLPPRIRWSWQPCRTEPATRCSTTRWARRWAFSCASRRF